MGSRGRYFESIVGAMKYPEERIPKPHVLSSCYVNNDIRIFLSSIGSTVLAFYVMPCNYPKSFIIEHRFILGAKSASETERRWIVTSNQPRTCPYPLSG